MLLEEFSKIEHQQGKLLYESDRGDTLTAITLFEEPVDEKYQAFANAGQKVLGAVGSNQAIYDQVRKEIEEKVREYTSYRARYKIVKATLNSETGSGNIIEGFSTVEPKISDGVVVSGYDRGLLMSGGLNSATWGKQRYGYMFTTR